MVIFGFFTVWRLRLAASRVDKHARFRESGAFEFLNSRIHLHADDLRHFVGLNVRTQSRGISSDRDHSIDIGLNAIGENN